MRVFVALPLSDAQRQSTALVRKQTMKPLSECLRWEQPDKLHLTLSFLGEVDADRVAILCRRLTEVAAKHPRFSWNLSGLGVFGNRGRSRVLWAGVHEPAGLLLPMQQAIQDVVLELGLSTDSRPFKPHITLARVVKPREAEPFWERLLSDWASWKTPIAEATECQVMGSFPDRGARRYDILARCSLGK